MAVTIIRLLRARRAPLLALGVALGALASLDALVVHVNALGAALRLLAATTP